MTELYNRENKLSCFALYIMTYKGLQTLQAIIDHDYVELISYVVIGIDKNTLNDYSTEIKTLCEENNISSYLRNDNIPSKSKYIITVSWRWLIKDNSSKLIIFHESLLPKYRGFAPLVNQLINNEKIIGVTAIFGEREYDTGDVIAQEIMEVNYPVKINQVIANISQLYIQLILKVFNEYKLKGEILSSYKQNEEDVTYSLWRDEQDYIIDWSKSAEFIHRFINAVGYPYKGASTLMDGKKIRIIDTEPLPDIEIENRSFGKNIYIKDGKPVIVCGIGILKIIDAYYDDTKLSIFPLKKFRIRLT